MGIITEDINRIVTRGTDLHSSIKAMDPIRRTAIRDLLPRAKATPNGSDRLTPKTEMRTLSMIPPHWSLDTEAKPKNDPSSRSQDSGVIRRSSVRKFLALL